MTSQCFLSDFTLIVKALAVKALVIVIVIVIVEAFFVKGHIFLGRSDVVSTIPFALFYL